MIKEFTIGTSHTLNLGNYESIPVEASITVVPPESYADDDRVRAVVDADSQKKLRALLEETFKAQSRKKTGGKNERDSGG